jgi:hypothetical protein
MALITRIRPQAGDVAVTDLVTAGTFTGTGATLVDVGAEKAWNVPTDSLYTLTVPEQDIQGSVDGSGATIAIRFRVNNFGSGSFDDLFGVESAIANRIQFTKSGPNLRGRLRTAGGDILAPVTSGVTFVGNVVTVVYRVGMSSASTADTGSMWVGGLARTGTDPNFVGGNANASASTLLQRAYFQTANGTNYDLLDYVYFDEELSNADCSSLADDIVGYFGSSTTPITFDGNIANQTFTVGDSVNVDLSGNWSGTQTPFTYALTSGSLTGAGLTLSSSGVLSGTATEATQTGLVITGTDADTNTAVSNSFSVTVNALAVGDPVIVFGADTALAFNTGGDAGLRRNLTGLSVDIYDATTRALVLSVTGHTTDSNAVMANIQNAALTPATEYRVVVLGADGSEAVFRETSQ